MRVRDPDTPPRLLLVDDDESILLSLPAVLASSGIEVFTASNLEEALEMLKDRDVDVVLTDVRLRGKADIDGLDLLTWVKDHRPDTRVVVMTGYGTEEIREAAIERGAEDYLEKSIPMPELVRRLRGLTPNR